MLPHALYSRIEAFLKPSLSWSLLRAGLRRWIKVLCLGKSGHHQKTNTWALAGTFAFLPRLQKSPHCPTWFFWSNLGSKTVKLELKNNVDVLFWINNCAKILIFWDSPHVCVWADCSCVQSCGTSRRAPCKCALTKILFLRRSDWT